MDDSGRPLVETDASERGAPEDTHEKPSNPSNQEQGQRTERTEPGRTQPIKWPKANEVAAWQKLDEDLSLILERGEVDTERTVTVFIQKEQNSNTINQFRSITLLNVEGKIFFSILANRLTCYLVRNGVIDASCQKAGKPGLKV